MDARRTQSRERLVNGLVDLGFTVAPSQVTPPAYSDKESLRQMYIFEPKKFIEERIVPLQRLERRALPFFVTGNQVCPSTIKPRIELVETPLQSEKFMYALSRALLRP